MIQTAGRVLRPEDNKIPVIVDYVDRRIGMLDFRATQRLEIFKKDIFAKVITSPPWRKKENTERRSEDRVPLSTKSQSGNPSQNLSHAPYRKQYSLFDLPEKQASRTY